MFDRVDLVATTRTGKTILDLHVQKYEEKTLRDDIHLCKWCQSECDKIISQVGYLKDCMINAIPYNGITGNMVWSFYIRVGNNRKDYTYSKNLKSIQMANSFVVDFE
jgi:hypothetical protein